VRTRVGLTVAGGVGRITLLGAERHNAVDPPWVAELDRAVRECAAHQDLRAILISAEGASFTVGGDLRHFAASAERLPAALDEMIAPYHVTLAVLAELPVPVVCAAQGGIGGGGLGLLWASDVVLLADDAKLATGFSKLGLAGDGGSSWYLPRLVGLRRAVALTLEGRVLSAAEALEWGLVSQVVAHDQLSATAEEVVQRFASGPTRAYGEMRRLIRHAHDVGLRAGLADELAATLRCGATADAREGISAFVARTAPHFTGE
jgi:2-(1,2-epoxy-1,2-dihydrophenyl)acetyl-CoA isomerase